MQPYADTFRRCWLPLLVIAVLFLPLAAHAASTGGSLPWDTPLTTLKNDLTGPVAFTISLRAPTRVPFVARTRSLRSGMRPFRSLGPNGP